MTSYRATIRADLAALYEKLQPRTVGCFNLAELSVLPLDAFVRGGSHAWFVDAHAGRAQTLLAGTIVEADPQLPCLACDGGLDGHDICAAYVADPHDAGRRCQRWSAIPHEAARCTQFSPGRKLRVINGDGGRGRGAGFATRVEGIIVRAAAPLIALTEAIALCKRAAHMNVPLPMEDGALELVISVLAPARLMEQPYDYFDTLMTRRFGPWRDGNVAELQRKVNQLQLALFRMQLDAHVHELARLTDPRRGRLYFATLPVEPTTSGVWSLERGVTECIDALARHFAFDFDTFPAEAFLRRAPDDRSVVVQAALFRPRVAEGSTR